MRQSHRRRRVTPVRAVTGGKYHTEWQRACVPVLGYPMGDDLA